jgi:hypothetical protein
MAEGVTVPFQAWAKREGLKGFHQQMPERLNSQYVEHREHECLPRPPEVPFVPLSQWSPASRGRT